MEMADSETTPKPDSHTRIPARFDLWSVVLGAIGWIGLIVFLLTPVHSWGNGVGAALLFVVTLAAPFIGLCAGLDAFFAGKGNRAVAGIGILLNASFLVLVVWQMVGR